MSKLAATLGLRPFGLSTSAASGVRSSVDPEDQLTNNNNETVNDEENNQRGLEESKRFFSRFAPPVAHHNMVQYSHLGKADFF